MDKENVSLCIISDNYMWIHNYLKIKHLVKEIYKTAPLLKKTLRQKAGEYFVLLLHVLIPWVESIFFAGPWARITKTSFYSVHPL